MKATIRPTQEQCRAILGTNIYIFHRAEGFYPIELPDDKTALDCVPLNPGTLKVENAVTGETIWQQTNN